MASKIFFPDEILFNVNLTDIEKNVLMCLYYSKNTNTHICTKSQKEIANIISCSIQHVSRIFKKEEFKKYVELIHNTTSKRGRPTMDYKLLLIPNKINKIKFKIIDQKFYKKYCYNSFTIINAIKFQHIFAFKMGFKELNDEEIYKIGNWSEDEYNKIIKKFKELEIISRKQRVELKWDIEFSEDEEIIPEVKEKIIKEKPVYEQKYLDIIKDYETKTKTKFPGKQIPGLIKKLTEKEKLCGLETTIKTVNYLAETGKTINFILTTNIKATEQKLTTNNNPCFNETEDREEVINKYLQFDWETIKANIKNKEFNFEQWKKENKYGIELEEKYIEIAKIFYDMLLVKKGSEEADRIMNNKGFDLNG